MGNTSTVRSKTADVLRAWVTEIQHRNDSSDSDRDLPPTNFANLVQQPEVDIRKAIFPRCQRCSKELQHCDGGLWCDCTQTLQRIL